MVVITSYDKEKFEIGKIYYTYYFQLNNKGDAIRYYTGIMKVKCKQNDYDKSNIDFDILESKELSNTLSHNIGAYLRGYGSAYCNFFNSYEDCIVHHDKELIYYSKNLKTQKRDLMLKKLITSIEPKKKKIEIESLQWMSSLSKKEIKYLKWIKDYYEGDI